MNFETLQLFCEVARRHSFSAGARALNVSQPAASQAVAQLEAGLEVLLIDRTKRPLGLTPQGRAYYEGLRALLQGYEELTSEIRSTRKQVAGTVRVAAIYSVGLHAMSRYVQRFMSVYPQTKVRLEYLRPNKVVDAVVEEEADLGLLSYPVATRALAVVSLRSEPMVFVCPPLHRLARKARIEARDLAGENFVAFDPDLAIRKAIDRSLRAGRSVPRVVMEFDNIENIKQAILAGAGVSILPEPTVRRESEQGTLAAVPLAMTELVRPIGILHRRRRHLAPAVKMFMELLKEPVDG